MAELEGHDKEEKRGQYCLEADRRTTVRLSATNGASREELDLTCSQLIVIVPHSCKTSDRKRCATRECQLEDVGKAARQSQNHQPRDAQLVSTKMLHSTQSTRSDLTSDSATYRLKDSDVTWLYGPLHEHADPVPPPKVASTHDRLDLVDSAAHMKSILKHRTISEMLTTPGRSASPAVEIHMDGSDANGGGSGVTTPKLGIIKSDTNLSAKKRKSGGSPPASSRLLSHPSLDRTDSMATADSLEEKRHISFNSRVDQCIAVDYPENDYSAYSDDDEDEEEDAAEASEETGSSDEGEVLTMRTSSSPRTTFSSASASSSRGSSPMSDHNIIAKLAPTRLKTSDVYPAPSPPVVDPSGFTSMGQGQAKITAGGLDGSAPGAEQSQWDDDNDLDYFNAPFASDRATASQQASLARARSVTDAPISASPADDLSTSPNTAASSGAAQPKGILKRRSHGSNGNGSDASTGASPSGSGLGSAFSPDTKSDADHSNFAAAAPASSSSPSALGTSYDPNDDRHDEESGRGRSSQRLGTSASYERIQEAARKSSASRGSASSTSPSGSADSHGAGGAKMGGAGAQQGQDRERRGSFRGRDQDGQQQRSGAASRLGVGAGESSTSDDDGDYDSRPASSIVAPSYGSVAATPVGGDKRGASSSASSRPRNSQQGSSSSMSPAGSQRLSVDLDNLPSNDPSAMGSAPAPGAGGPTPLNTPTMALARSRAGKARQMKGYEDDEDNDDDDDEDNDVPRSKAASSGASRGGEPRSPEIPRRTRATGALVAPSGADRQAGVRVPLADDFVEEDEGGIVGRAVEIVNTAKDLIAAVWPSRRKE